MASVKIQDVVVFLLVIQSILGHIGCQTTSHLIRKSTVNIRKLILEEAEVIPESDFQFDTKLLQIVQENNFTSNYFLISDSDFGKKSVDLGPLVISRKSIDTGQSVVILDKGEDGLDPSEVNAFVVLKKARELEVANYFASLVYIVRIDGEFRLEWDSWSPGQRHGQILRLNSVGQTNLFHKEDHLQTDLLYQIGEWTKGLVAATCNRERTRIAEPMRIRKRSLFDSFFGDTEQTPSPSSTPPLDKPNLKSEIHAIAEGSASNHGIPSDPFANGIHAKKFKETSGHPVSDVSQPTHLDDPKSVDPATGFITGLTGVVPIKGSGNTETGSTVASEEKELLADRVYLVKPLWYHENNRGKSMGRKFPVIMATPKRPPEKTLTISNAKTNAGNAIAKSLNKQGGTAVANAEVTAEGNAYASSKAVGTSKPKDVKIAVANANAVNGGTAIAKAETDGFQATPGPVDTAAEGIPDSNQFIKETENEFARVQTISHVSKSKRSIGSNENSRKCKAIENTLDTSDRKFFSKYSAVKRQISLCLMSKKLSKGFKDWTSFNKFKCDPYHKHNYIHRLGIFRLDRLSSAFTDLHSLAEADSKQPNELKVKIYSMSHDSQTMDQFDSAMTPVLKFLNLESEDFLKSYIRGLFMSGSVLINKNSVLKIQPSYPLLKKHKLSVEEVRNLTALVIISSYTSAVQKLTKRQKPNGAHPILYELELLTLAITEAIYINNLPLTRQHTVKIGRGIISILESILVEVLKNSRNCSVFNEESNLKIYKHFETEFQVLLNLLRLSQSEYLKLLNGFNSEDDVTELFWKYNSHSYPITNRLAKCLLNDDNTAISD